MKDNTDNIILDVQQLCTKFDTDQGTLTAVNNVSFTLKEREILGVVGESGSGKTVTNMSIMRLYDEHPNTHITGSVYFRGQNLLELSHKEMRQIRGGKIAMIFQNSMSCLNPFLTIGKQIMETILLHKNMSKKDAQDYAIEMLRKVHIANPEKRIHEYPHVFSGGMCQRVMIAIALCCEPEILIADEPTTALDVTVQAQILDLIQELMENFNTAVIFITHDMGVIARLCQKVCVMYAGSVVEYAPVDDIFYAPKHPYTQGLLQSIPLMTSEHEMYLKSIPGSPPDLLKLDSGCPFSPRCTYVSEKCKGAYPPYTHIENSMSGYRCYHPINNTIGKERSNNYE